MTIIFRENSTEYNSCVRIVALISVKIPVIPQLKYVKLLVAAAFNYHLVEICHTKK